MTQDQAKIDAKIEELNRSTPDHPKWIEVDNYHALTRVELNSAIPNFVPNSGIPLKVFVNTDTGEVRSFVAVFFEKQ